MSVRLSGISPFAADSVDEILESNKQSEIDYPIDYWKDVSSEAVDLVMKMTESDQYKRPTIKECLCHPWFSATQLDKKLLEHVSRNLRKFGKEKGKRDKNWEIRGNSQLFTPTVLKRTLSNSRPSRSDIEDYKSFILSKDKSRRSSILGLTPRPTSNNLLSHQSVHLKSDTAIDQYNPFFSKFNEKEEELKTLDEDLDIPTEKELADEEPGLSLLNGHSFVNEFKIPFSIAEEGVSKKIFKSISKT